MQWIVDLVTKTPFSLASLLLGVILVLLAGFGVFPYGDPWPLLDPISRVLIGGLGVLLVAASVYLRVLASTSESGRQDNRRPKRIGCTIRNPIAGAELPPGWTEVAGRFSEPVDEPVQLYLEDAGVFWFQSFAHRDSDRMGWVGRVYMSGTPGSGVRILVVRAGENTQMLAKYYTRVGQATSQWVPLFERPSDFVTCCSVDVVRGA